MKRILVYIIGICLSVTMGSCDQEVDVWDSETLDYSGRFNVEVLSEDMQTTITHFDDGKQFDIYNTAANLQNEFWIEDLNSIFPLKAKFFVDGTSEMFNSKDFDFANLGVNVPAISLPSATPTSVGEEVTEDREYVKCALIEGKIMPKAATTKGGNVTDSLYLKLKFLSGSVKFVSYEVPESLRVDPEKVEYSWKAEAYSYDQSKDEVYVVSGQRYTGFSEDQY